VEAVTSRAAPGTAAAQPEFVEPMLAGSAVFPGGADWAIEFAWEGQRALAYVRPNRVRLLSSTGRPMTASFPELDAALRRIAPPDGLVLDGTVVAQGPGRTPRRRALQSRVATSRPSEALIRRVPVSFLVGDVLWHDGHATLELAYRRRRDLCEALPFDGPSVCPTPSFPATELDAVMQAADQHGLDALYARQLDAPYRPGRRSRGYLRLPVRRVRQVVVGGWSAADPRRPERTISALLLGVPQGAGLRYVGRAGLRSAEDRTALAAALPRLRQASSPFDAPLPAEVERHAVWMAPQLVGRVEFADWLPDGRLRLPTWRGLLGADEVDATLFVQPPPRAAAAAQPVPAPPPQVEQRRLEQHFVYNALNTIASVIRRDPDRAHELLLGFADLNRAAERQAAGRSTLGEELAVVRAYLDLEQARFGRRLAVRIDVEPGLHGLSVAPLALLEAVRTTVQQRIEPRPDGGTLVIAVQARAGECTVGVADEDPQITVGLGAAGGGSAQADPPDPTPPAHPAAGRRSC